MRGDGRREEESRVRTSGESESGRLGLASRIFSTRDSEPSSLFEITIALSLSVDPMQGKMRRRAEANAREISRGAANPCQTRLRRLRENGEPRRRRSRRRQPGPSTSSSSSLLNKSLSKAGTLVSPDTEVTKSPKDLSKTGQRRSNSSTPAVSPPPSQILQESKIRVG